MSNTVEIFDRIMGSGKTSAICTWMKDNPQNKYIYVSPMLSEVTDRIPTECHELEFTTPSTEEHNSKSEHILELLWQGKNICTTHSLYELLTEEHTEAVALQGYVLVIDEEVDFIKPYTRYHRDDIMSLEDKGFLEIDYDVDGGVKWLWEDMKDNTVYSRLRRDCNMGLIYVTKRGRDTNKTMIVTHVPPKLVDVVERTIVLTYKFTGSVMDRFFSLRGYEMIPFTEMDTYRKESEIIGQIGELINYIDTPSIRKIKNSDIGAGMSSSWYDNAKVANRDRIGKAISSAARSVKATSDSMIYTMPKKYAIADRPSKKDILIKVPRYNSEMCWLHSGCRATNAYSDRTTAIHAYNRYPSVPVQSYLQDYGDPVLPEEFALSELLQWVWRTSIRNNEPINLGILSRRMDNIFKDWLK